MSETNTVSPLRQRMIEDMAARKLDPHTQRSHIHSCKRFAAWLKRSPDTATPDEVRQFPRAWRVKKFFWINISSLPTFREGCPYRKSNPLAVPIVNPICWQLIENRAMLLLDV